MDARKAELRRVSRELLGSSYRLEVAAAIHEAVTDAVYARALAGDIPGAGDNQVGECLKHFETAGLLRRNPSPGGRAPQTFSVIDSVYWRFCGELRDEVLKRRKRGR
jgi:hypothetical protein